MVLNKIIQNPKRLIARIRHWLFFGSCQEEYSVLALHFSLFGLVCNIWKWAQYIPKYYGNFPRDWFLLQRPWFQRRLTCDSYLTWLWSFCLATSKSIRITSSSILRFLSQSSEPISTSKDQINYTWLDFPLNLANHRPTWKCLSRRSGELRLPLPILHRNLHRCWLWWCRNSCKAWRQLHP